MSDDSKTIGDGLIAAIVNEGQWLAASMVLAFTVVALLLMLGRARTLPARRRVWIAMNVLAGVTIGTMAFGHLLAVTTKLLLGTLTGSIAVFYAIGIALAVPSWALILHVRHLPGGDQQDQQDRRAIVLNAWLAATLLALGLHNLPLAATAILNVAYGLHSRRVVGWSLASLALVVNVSLFIGSLVFWASGQTFEQFSGME
jgi:hypothetical protein